MALRAALLRRSSIATHFSGVPQLNQLQARWQHLFGAPLLGSVPEEPAPAQLPETSSKQDQTRFFVEEVCTLKAAVSKSCCQDIEESER